MRPIKFRGRDAYGKLHYGDLNHSGKYVLISNDGKPRIFVEPESVAQLVGYDCDGNEVYEGDVFVVSCGTEIAARFFDNLTPNAKLKEAQS